MAGSMNASEFYDFLRKQGRSAENEEKIQDEFHG
jgi:hypothetical protein